MDNSANPATPASQPVNSSPQDSSKDKNSWAKYFGVELLIIVIVVVAILIYFLKPFNLLFQKTVPKDMMGSTDANGKRHQLKPVTSIPSVISIQINSTGFDPQFSSASGSAQITFINNSPNPVVVQSLGNTFPEKNIPPIGSAQVVVAQKGDYKFTVKGSPEKTGEIIVN